MQVWFNSSKHFVYEALQLFFSSGAIPVQRVLLLKYRRLRAYAARKGGVVVCSIARSWIRYVQG